MRRLVHNLIAHPLLVLCPPLGEWLHDRTAPTDRLAPARPIPYGSQTLTLEEAAALFAPPTGPRGLAHVQDHPNGLSIRWEPTPKDPDA